MDFLFFETGDGGDMLYQNGDIKLDKSLFTSVYLAHFGGNKDVITKNDNSINTNRAWWGNLFTRDKEQLKLISNLETALRNTPLNSLAPEKLKIAAEKDLAYLVEGGILNNFEVSITIESQIRVRIQETLIEPTGKQTDLSFIWDNTRQVVISDYALPATTKQSLKILDYIDGDIVNNDYLPVSWTNNNVFSVNVGFIKDGVKTIVESNITGRNSTIFSFIGSSTVLKDFTLFVENAGYDEIRDDVNLFNPVLLTWIDPPVGVLYDPRDPVPIEMELNAVNPVYITYYVTYTLYTSGTRNIIETGDIGLYAFGIADTFTFRDFSTNIGTLELTATIPGTKIKNKIIIEIG